MTSVKPRLQPSVAKIRAQTSSRLQISRQDFATVAQESAASPRKVATRAVTGPSAITAVASLGKPKEASRSQGWSQRLGGRESRRRFAA